MARVTSRSCGSRHHSMVVAKPALEELRSARVPVMSGISLRSCGDNTDSMALSTHAYAERVNCHQIFYAGIIFIGLVETSQTAWRYPLKCLCCKSDGHQVCVVRSNIYKSCGDIAYTIQQYNTIQLYCLCVEKSAFWLVIYIKTFNTVNNKTSTTQ